MRLAHHAANRFGAAQPSRALNRKRHRGLSPYRSFSTEPDAKCRSSAAISDSVVAAGASTVTGNPALRIASAVTDPTAANVQYRLISRNASSPRARAKLSKDEGLKKVAIAAPS